MVTREQLQRIRQREIERLADLPMFVNDEGRLESIRLSTDGLQAIDRAIAELPV